MPPSTQTVRKPRSLSCPGFRAHPPTLSSGDVQQADDLFPARSACRGRAVGRKVERKWEVPPIDSYADFLQNLKCRSLQPATPSMAARTGGESAGLNAPLVDRLLHCSTPDARRRCRGGRQGVLPDCLVISAHRFFLSYFFLLFRCEDT